VSFKPLEEEEFHPAPDRGNRCKIDNESCTKRSYGKLKRTDLLTNRGDFTLFNSVVPIVVGCNFDAVRWAIHAKFWIYH